MLYRTLGNTGLKVSEIGFGTWGLGGTSYGKADDNESVKALDFAFEKGINFYDTSDLYGDGHSEVLLGKTFDKKRDKIIIASKGGMLPHTSFVMPQDFSEDYLSNALERSLKRLKTDYIDVYKLHSPQIEDIEKNNCLRTLEKFQKSGKIRFFGVSARSPHDALVYIEKYGFKIVQVNFNIIDQRAREIDLFEIAKKNNAYLIIRTPLVFGFLTGNLTGKEKFESNDHRGNWPKEQLESWANAPKLFEVINKNKKRTLTQLALQFCLFEEAVSTVIPGMMKINEVKENAEASGLNKLSKEEIENIYSIYNNHKFYDKNAKK